MQSANERKNPSTLGCRGAPVQGGLRTAHFRDSANRIGVSVPVDLMYRSNESP